MSDYFGALVTNNLNRQNQERAYEQQRELQHDAQSYNTLMWRMQQAYDSPMAQMMRFKSAGLNPNLIYGSMQQGTAPSISAGSAPSSAQAPAMSMLETAQIGLINAQRENIEADTELKSSDSGLKDRQKANIGFSEYLQQSQFDLEKRVKEKGMQLTDADIKVRNETAGQLRAMIDKIGVETAILRLEETFQRESYDTRLAIVEESLSNLEADTGLKHAQKGYYRAQAKQILDTLQPMIDKLTAEANEINSRADLNRQQKQNLITQRMVQLYDNAYLIEAFQPMKLGEKTMQHNFNRTLNLFNHMFTHFLRFNR